MAFRVQNNHNSLSPTSPRYSRLAQRTTMQKHLQRLYKQGHQRWSAWQRTFSRQSTTTKAIILAVLACLIAAMIALLAGSVAFYYYWSILLEGPAQQVPVDGTTSKFTLVIMSHPARLRTLKTVVKHYGNCPSVSEILIVWSNGPPPDIKTELISNAPVRLREEPINSINNRFHPDPLIKTQAIMQLDDDMLIWCSDIERGFAEWRKHQHALVGFFPRLIVGDPTGVTYVGEKDVYRRDRFNAVLTVAEFLDKRALDWYWDESLAPARAIVDKLFNCEDILMNFVIASKAREIGETQAVRFVRPRRRLDISQLTKYGISRGSTHILNRQKCSADFMEMFGGNILTEVEINWDEQVSGKPMCGILPGVGCVYF